MVKNSTGMIVLCIEPMDTHQERLVRFLPQTNLYFCSSLDASLALIRKHRIPVVLCSSEFAWRELLAHFHTMSQPPFLIVTSRLADDRLWSEALNLGAYDVLAKPFDATEVTRVVAMAWNRWVERSALPFRPAPDAAVTQPAYA